MKKDYVQPSLAVIIMEETCPLLAGSGNSITGTIDKTGEKIEAGSEDEDGGMEASAKENHFSNFFED